MEKNPEIKPISKIKFVAAKLAQRCPVCNGFGTINYGKATCHACNGRGYVLVPAREEAENEK